MVATIITAVLPLLLRLIGMGLDKIKANEEAKKMIKELIRLSKDDGLIAVRNSDSQTSHHDEILKQIEKDKVKP